MEHYLERFIVFKKFLILLLGIDCSKQNPIDYDILLRSPGQSANEKLDVIRDRQIDKLFYFSLFMIIGLIAIIIFKLSWFWMIGLIALYFYSLWNILINIIEMRNYKLGRDGERSVAQLLSVIARQVSKENTNMHIYHDVVNKEKVFNIDHIVVSKKGIFIIETKTYRKIKGKENIIRSDGNYLYKNNQKMTYNIPLQIKGQLKWLQSQLHQKCGKKYEIIPIVAFVGWYVEGKKINDIYIATAKNLHHIMENQYKNILYDNEELKRIVSAIHQMAIVGNNNHNDICK